MCTMQYMKNRKPVYLHTYSSNNYHTENTSIFLYMYTCIHIHLQSYTYMHTFRSGASGSSTFQLKQDTARDHTVLWLFLIACDPHLLMTFLSLSSLNFGKHVHCNSRPSSSGFLMPWHLWKTMNAWIGSLFVFWKWVLVWSMLPYDANVIISMSTSSSRMRVMLAIPTTRETWKEQTPIIAWQLWAGLAGPETHLMHRVHTHPAIRKVSRTFIKSGHGLNEPVSNCTPGDLKTRHKTSHQHVNGVAEYM